MQKVKVQVDMEKVGRLMGKIYKFLGKKSRSPVESYLTLKVMVMFMEEEGLSLTPKDESDLRAYVRSMVLLED